MDSDEDSYYGELSYDDDVEETAEVEELVHPRRRKSYTILTEERIRQLQDNDISQVCSLLSVSRSLACTLLRRYNWSVTTVSEKWFADEEKVRESLGLLPEQKSLNPPPPDNNNYNLCNICFDESEVNNMFSATCGHPFCLDCWKSYVSISINDGPACLRLCCPDPKCKVDVGPEMIELLASEADKEKYNRYLFQSYVDGHANMKWCPGDGCDRAVQIESDEREYYDVTCGCSLTFCWRCMDESHRPVKCETVRDWIKHNASEEHNNRWILAYTKPCPKCSRKIEKNSGCNHMTCRDPCKYEFCWFCLTPWKEAHYACNRYDEDEYVANTKKNLKRYSFYYERWATNNKSREIAVSNLKWARDELIRITVDNQRLPEDEVGLVIEAFERIVESRSALKWSYTYGYYLPWRGKSAKRELFEYLQGQAQRVLERLNYCAEKGMAMCTNADFSLHDFRDFTNELRGLNDMTRNHFEDLVRALENNLSEVSEITKSTVKQPPAAPSKRRTR